MAAATIFRLAYMGGAYFRSWRNPWRARPITANMKILVVGANGTIGKAIVDELNPRHEIVTAGRTSGDQNVDIADPASIRALFDAVGNVDAVVNAAGDVHFGPLLEMTPEQLEVGLSHKLMGQVHLALEAAKHLNPGGSVTLIAGSLSHDPVRYGASASLVNSAIEGFVRAAAIEFPPGTRINAVSPTVLCESMGAYGPFFRGTECVPAKRVAMAFSKSVEGAQTGQVYFVE
jgi:NAD(P)-dependent dehydrogenase (short-subunit alcohol dehydrogenase family)